MNDVNQTLTAEDLGISSGTEIENREPLQIVSRSNPQVKLKKQELQIAAWNVRGLGAWA